MNAVFDISQLSNFFFVLNKEIYTSLSRKERRFFIYLKKLRVYLRNKNL